MLDVSHAFATFPELQTERCLLRETTLDHAVDVLRVMGHPQVTRHLARLPLANLDEAIERIHIYQRNFEGQSGFVWMIEHQGQVIGNGVLFNLSAAHHRAELGYALLPEYWGQGLATEVAAAIVNFGFGTVGLHSIEAHTDADNAGSQHVLEKLGFVREGYFRENVFDPVINGFGDSAVYSLLKSGWISRPQTSP